MIPRETSRSTDTAGWYLLVLHGPEKAFDRASFRAIGPFRCREDAITQGREQLERDGKVRVRITHVEQPPFAKSMWHRAESLDPP
jgi:hypothetical protein